MYAKRMRAKRPASGAAERAIETAMKIDEAMARIDQRLSALEARMDTILIPGMPRAALATPSTRPVMASMQEADPPIMARLAALEIGLEAAMAQTIAFGQRCQKLEEALYGKGPQGSAG